MASGFHPQNAEAVLLVVEGHPFHKPGKNLARFVNFGMMAPAEPSSAEPRYTANLNRSNRIAKRSGLSLSRYGRCMAAPFSRFNASTMGTARRREVCKPREVGAH